MTKKKAVLLTPILIYSGITQSFFFGTFPLFINQFSPDQNDLSIKLVNFFLLPFIFFMLSQFIMYEKLQKKIASTFLDY